MGGLDWLQLLQMFGSAAGAVGGAGGAGAGLSGVGLPDAGAVVPVTPPPVTGGAMMPDAGAFMPSSGSFMPQMDMTPRPVARPAVRPAAAAPQLGTDTVMPGPDTFRPANMPQLNTDDIMPGPNTEGFRRSWWQRNIGDPVDKAWDKAWTEDPKTGQSPAMKTLQGLGSTAGKLGAAPAATPAPAIASGGGAGSGYRPAGAINAAEMALTREKWRQMLQQRATLNAPWLKQRLLAGGGGLME